MHTDAHTHTVKLSFNLIIFEIKIFNEKNSQNIKKQFKIILMRIENFKTYGFIAQIFHFAT